MSERPINNMADAVARIIELEDQLAHSRREAMPPREDRPASQPAMGFALALGLLWTLGGVGSLVYFAVKYFAP